MIRLRSFGPKAAPAGALLLLLCVMGPALPGLAQRGTLPPPSATEVYTPVPPVVTPGLEPGWPPSDALMLLAGGGQGDGAWRSVKDTTRPSPWAFVPATRRDPFAQLIVRPVTGDIATRLNFTSVQLHLEWRTPDTLTGTGQGQGNSGVFLQGRYEVQILNSYKNNTYVNGQAASIYKQHPPRVNAMRPPGQWQVYDIIYRAPRFSPEGQMTRPPRVTVLHNGVLVHEAVELAGPTVYQGPPVPTPHGPAPIVLQDHGQRVRFRNIWVRPLPDLD